jgi:hypothetical protein
LQYLKATELAEKEQRLQEIQYQQLILLGEEREANQRELLPQLLKQHQLQQLLQQLQQQL